MRKDASADNEKMFRGLRTIFRRFESKCIVLENGPSKYSLGMRKVRAKDGYRLWLGGVEKRKTCVSVHFMPLYYKPVLKKLLSASLKKRLTGKACFNFKVYNRAELSEVSGFFNVAYKSFLKAQIPGFIEDSTA